MAKIYIGVGHGGTDPGAVSGTYREAAMALEIANACTAELRRHGAQVMQSRTTDETEKLADKIAECNRYAPDIAIDIHLNAGGGDGFEVYHAKSSTKGKTLGTSIETAVKALGQNSRGVKTLLTASGKDYFGFVRQTSCPAVLVECAFIDSKDVQIVDTATKRTAMGVAIAHGLLRHLGIAIKSEVSEMPSTSTAPVVKNLTLPTIAAGLGTKAQIRRLQKLLNDHSVTGANGQKLDEDGIWGKNTEHAVKTFQTNAGLTVDGKAGTVTITALIVL